ncbi:MAG: trehalose-6-phosphate synthase, partial [Smithella sp.]
MKLRNKKISFQSLWLGLRFVIPLTIALTLLAYAVMPLVEELNLRWFVRDLDSRAQLITATLQEPLGELLKQGNKTKIANLLARATKDERLFAIGYCDGEGNVLYRTPTFPQGLNCNSPAISSQEFRSLLKLPKGLVHVAVNPISYAGAPAGSLILLHDMSFVEIRSADTRKYIIIMFAVIGLVISLITVLVAHLSWRGWMHGVRALLRGEKIVQPLLPPSYSELRPLVGDLRAMMRIMNAERRFGDDVTISWTPNTLRKLLHRQLTGDQILVVSNREPYIHVKKENKIKVNRPASGLVTAVEPVMRACSGTWISHGSGTADREVVDSNDRVRVPPEHPEYTLKRIWLSTEEENGYYYGFANEGLWPLCHIVHVRPIFRTSDWEYYKAVNQRFADAVIKEANKEDPVVLIQDYHFALLPKMIHDILPKATIITFWHIP